MNETQSVSNGPVTEVVNEKEMPVWRFVPVVLAVTVTAAIGLLLGIRPPGSSIVSVRLLDHHLIVARGGIPAVLALMALLVIGILMPAWAIINCIGTPKSTFTSLGRSKGRWVVSMIVVFFIGDVSLLLVPIYYLWRIRPQLSHERANAHL